MKNSTALVLTLCLLGCVLGISKCAQVMTTPSPVEHFRQVDALPDGRIISCLERDMGFFHGVHYIYFVSNPDGGHTVTTNSETGKNHRVVVEIDGVKYTTPDE